MRRNRLTPSAAAVVVLALAMTGSTTLASPASGAPQGPPAQIRVDQVGYGAAETKRAYLMAGAGAAGATFVVRDDAGKRVFAAKVGQSRGGWNASYTAVHPLDFSRLRRPGQYRITVAGAVQATSPTFRIARTGALFNPLAADTNRFFQVQRDGAHVIKGQLNRKPSHLTDRRATVYAQPVFKGDGGDVPAEPLKPIGGPVDVEGGWFDAGDFVKFTHASAYSLAEMLIVQREQGRKANPALAAETKHGLKWLDKVWDAKRNVLYAQVGIGTGSEEFGFLGDHDVWRLPEADDALSVKPGDEMYFIKHRPVFPANAPGAKVSPNLAGRVAAAFALAAQLESARNPRLARRYLQEGASIFAQAKTADVGELVTAFPHAYYPEDSWQDDMEFGAAELALAGWLLDDRRTAGWLKAATHWAKAYTTSDSTDTLNLYDTSALAHTDLVRLMRVSDQTGLEITEAALIADLRRQLDGGVENAAKSPFGAAANVTDFDAATRSFGYVATVRLYESITGDHRYAAFGTQQRNFALGANAWGVSLVIGAGTRFPHCPQHQVANLAGSLGGGRNVIAGAVVNGPNGAENFQWIGIPDGAKACPADGVNVFAAYDTTDARFLDDVRAWPSVEPAIDFTSTGMLAFHLVGGR
jgi:hypothetical protein